MKLQVSFDIADLEQAIYIAHAIQDSVDIFEVGTVLLYQYGVQAVDSFVKTFPHKIILADTKLVDRAREGVEMMANAHVHWISIMAGACRDTQQAACAIAQERGIKIMLDLLDSNAPGQAAMEAKTLGVHALLVHRLHEEHDFQLFAEKWEMVRGNTLLPIFVSGAINKQNIHDFLRLKPDGLVIGSAIVEAANPAQEAADFFALINK